MVVLISFCCKFKTEKNEEHDKKIKVGGKSKGKNKANKMMRRELAPAMNDELGHEPNTAERLMVPTKSQTLTNI